MPKPRRGIFTVELGRGRMSVRASLVGDMVRSWLL